MSAEINFGVVEGEACGRNGCAGTIDAHPVENCSCHINPPCRACVTNRKYCSACGWSAEEEDRSFYLNGFRCVSVNEADASLGPFSPKPLISWERRPLDPTKIDYHVDHHTYSSQVCEGVYPDGTSREEVIARVKGTFGGRFEHFGGGRFKYIAYTE